ncbi:MAG TPA: GTPase Era [Thermoanaerobaculia bacterium]|nr:GTPase Era [Thermoanaerobaculia bacterium]
MSAERRSGTVAIVGRPNAGKSTLVNALVGRKVAIVSDKPQTTRRRVLGILTAPEGQLVFVDTPGLHRPLHRLNKVMMDEALEAIREVDVRVLVIDAAERTGGGDRFALRLLADAPAPRIAVLNKVDRVSKPRLLPRMAELAEAKVFDEVVPISALTGDGLDRLRAVLFASVPEGDELYPEETITTTAPRVHYGEVIREKLLARMREEIPYGLGVVVEEGRDEPGKKLTVLTATIVVDRESHKGIVLGSGGSVLKEAATEARLELEAAFGRRFYLDLNVAARPGWREDPRFLAGLTS